MLAFQEFSVANSVQSELLGQALEQSAESRADRWLSRMEERVRQLRGTDRAYLLGAVLFCVATGMLAIGYEVEMARAWRWLSGAIFSGALGCEVYQFVRRRADALWLKLLMVPLAVMGSAMGLGGGAHLVARATGQDPEMFPRAITFMAPVAAVPVLALIATVVLAIAFFGVILALGARATSKEPAKRATAPRVAAWLAGLVATAFLITPLRNEGSTFHQLSISLAGWSAQVLDMHPNEACTRGPQDRVRRINDELVLRAWQTDKGTFFRREACPLTAQ